MINRMVRATRALLLFTGVVNFGGLLAADGVFSLKEVDVPPKPLSREAPVYPFELVRNGVNGYVELGFIVDVNGRPRAIRSLHSNNPWLERSAIRALHNWRYSPALKAGKPVEVAASQLIEFSSDGASGGPWEITKGKDHAKLPPELRWDTPPLPVWITFPVYPFESLQAKQAGKTRHRILIDPKGQVVGLQQEESTTPELGLASRAMLEAWKFSPAKNDRGEPCFATFAVEHVFKLTGRSDAPITASARNILGLLDKASDKIVAAKTLDRVPPLVSSQKPVFPAALRETQQEGEATIEFFIDDEGDVQLPHIISATQPEFGYAAAQAVSSWRFEPPLKEGKPVITKLRAPVRFKNSPLAKATP